MLQETMTGTAVATEPVAVITFLGALPIHTDNSVAAGRVPTGSRAVIFVKPVTIVTILTGVDTAVTTHLGQAQIGAAIAGDKIAIVTVFIALILRRQVGSHDTIAATSPSTGIRAPVGLDEVAVVTVLVLVEPLPITAPGRCTGRCACIVIEGVAIIAEFTFLQSPITATGQLAVSTSICGVCIAIITLLIRPQNAIATTSPPTGTQTGIPLDPIAVITFLVACSARKGPLATHTVTT